MATRDDGRDASVMSGACVAASSGATRQGQIRGGDCSCSTWAGCCLLWLGRTGLRPKARQGRNEGRKGGGRRDGQGLSDSPPRLAVGRDGHWTRSELINKRN